MSPRRFNPISDVTLDFKRRDGKRVSEDEARRALWAAHKLVQSGGSVKDLKEWEIEAIDWRADEREYHYGASRIDEVLGNLGGILETIGLEGIKAVLRTGRRSKRGQND